MEKSEVEAILEKALRQLESEHPKLFQLGVHERTLVSHLVCYLRDQFPRHSVDMEYNRQGPQNETKRREPEGDKIFPDLIVHCRGNNKSNLLAVECKKSGFRGSDKKKDIEKLKGMRRERCYTYAAFVVLKGGGSKVCWV